MKPRYATYLDEVSLPQLDDEINNFVILWDYNTDIVGWLDRTKEDVPEDLDDLYPDEEQRERILDYCFSVIFCGDE